MERIGLPSFPPQLTFFPFILWDFRRNSGARVYHPLEPAPLLSLPSAYSRRAPPLLHIRASVVFWIQTLNSHFLGGVPAVIIASVHIIYTLWEHLQATYRLPLVTHIKQLKPTIISYLWARLKWDQPKIACNFLEELHASWRSDHEPPEIVYFIKTYHYSSRPLLDSWPASFIV